MTPSAAELRAISEWLVSYDTGMSSKALAACFLGGPFQANPPHPHDPADLGRCLRLIERVPGVRACVDALGGCSREWRALATHWDRLADIAASEDWPTGYDAMRRVLLGGAP